MLWLIGPTLRRAPHRLILAAVAIALPVATLAATLLYIDASLRSMTRTALQPVQVDMRALAATLDTDMRQVAQRVGSIRDVQRVDLFGSADVTVSVPGRPERIPARLFAVDQAYLAHHTWVHTTGDVSRGALLSGELAARLAAESTVSIDAGQLELALPITGQVDLREASAWFAIPSGDVQGDLAIKPRAIVVNYSTFERTILPELRRSLGRTASVTNPGLTDLPPASNEAHILVDHRAYPADPAAASTWSASLRRVLERASPGDVIVADNAAEPLSEATVDATNAKILFILLGVPGALVAAALGLTAAAALAEAHRREDALLRLRGATDRQLARLAVGQGVLAGVVGTILGLLVAAGGASAVVGHQIWDDIPPERLAQTAMLGIVMGGLTVAARLIPMVRASRRSAIMADRRQLETRRAPIWLRTRLDIALLVVGAAILGANILIGGLKPTPGAQARLYIIFAGTNGTTIDLAGDHAAVARAAARANVQHHRAGRARRRLRDGGRNVRRNLR